MQVKKSEDLKSSYLLGKNTSFLFTLAPRMRIYPSTSYNDHYQYLNTFQQTMPNGLVS